MVSVFKARFIRRFVQPLARSLRLSVPTVFLIKFYVLGLLTEVPASDLLHAPFRNISGVCLFISPAATFYRVYKKKATDSFSAMPYLCTLLNCVLWLLYGMPFVTKSGVLIMTINGIGAILELSYLSIFMKYAPKPSKIRTAKVGGFLGGFFILVVLVVVFATHHMHSRHTIVGILCVIITIVMYAAPLSVMRLVIKTRSVEYMPLPLSVMVLINSSAWSAYALLKSDIYIMIPNFFGVALGIAQLILYWCYHGAKKPTLQEELEMGQKSAQQGSTELPTGALDISNPSDVVSSNMDSVSLKDSSSVETKVSSSPTGGSTLPTYSAIAFSSHNLCVRT